jgi:hypothetical protein
MAGNGILVTGISMVCSFKVIDKPVTNSPVTNIPLPNYNRSKISFVRW